MADERELGIQAIVELQGLAGVTESREDAEKGWDSMLRSEQVSTMRAHQSMFPEKYN